MLDLTAFALLLGVVAVGVLHTMVPDHWAPIALLARQRGWSRGETARAAAQAGIGHVLTTLVFGAAVWGIGASAAGRFGHIVDLLASVALVGFGLWIAVGAYREMRMAGADDGDHEQPRGHGHGHDHDHEHHGHTHLHAWDRDSLYAPLRSAPVSERHVHVHRHGQGLPHLHWHDHPGATAHAVTLDTVNAPPLHEHVHRTTGRTALLLVLGSSPMVEGIPAFFAASRYGVGVIIAMSIAFASSTIATYIVMSVASASSLQRLRLGRFERYGEVISGLVMALIGLGFGISSIL